MLLIDCPWCGERAQNEFRYAGDAERPRPADLERAPDTGDRSPWFRQVYLRANPRGSHRELWQHVFGCRGFVVVRRDTATHEIYETFAPGEEPPGDRSRSRTGSGAGARQRPVEAADGD